VQPSLSRNMDGSGENLCHGECCDAKQPGCSRAMFCVFAALQPWHPLNFRNQARVFEAEAEKAAIEKKRLQAKVKLLLGRLNGITDRLTGRSAGAQMPDACVRNYRQSFRREDVTLSGALSFSLPQIWVL
jgi:N-terminal domain of CBF1 interacting co-repressor CIR